MKRKTPPISNYFKPVGSTSNSAAENTPEETEITEQPTVHNDFTPDQVVVQTSDQITESSSAIPEQTRVGSTPYERDPAKRQQIWELPIDKQVEARQFYVSVGPYQQYLREYPYNADNPKHRRRFQFSWFKQFPWLEYSPSANRAYCFPCFLFSRKPIGKCGSDTFTISGFDKWKKVNSGTDCAFLTHMGKDASSAHNYSTRCLENFKDSTTHIDKVIEKSSAKTIADARLRLKVTIDSIR